jgi:hypothetical protein
VVFNFGLLKIRVRERAAATVRGATNPAAYKARTNRTSLAGAPNRSTVEVRQAAEGPANIGNFAALARAAVQEPALFIFPSG